jgi:hypothetical protein
MPQPVFLNPGSIPIMRKVITFFIDQFFL